MGIRWRETQVKIGDEMRFAPMEPGTGVQRRTAKEKTRVAAETRHNGAPSAVYPYAPFITTRRPLGAAR